MWQLFLGTLLAAYPLVGGPLYALAGLFGMRPDPWLYVFLMGSGLWALGQLDAGLGVAAGILGQGLLGWLVLRAARRLGPHPAYALALAGVGLWASWRYFEGPGPGYREQLWSFNPNGLGAWMALGGGLSAFLGRPGWLGTLGFVGAGLGVWASGSRTALFGWLALGFLAFLLRLSRFWQRVGLVGFLLGLGVGVLGGGSLELGRFGTVLDQGYAGSQQRVEIWRQAWRAFREHPLSGVASFPSYFQGHLTERAGALGMTETSHAHSLPLQALAEGGVLGGLGVLVWLGGAAWLLWRRRAWAGLALMAGALALNLTDYTWFYAGVYYPLWVGIGWSLRDQPVRMPP